MGMEVQSKLPVMSPAVTGLTSAICARALDGVSAQGALFHRALW